MKYKVGDEVLIIGRNAMHHNLPINSIAIIVEFLPKFNFYEIKGNYEITQFLYDKDFRLNTKASRVLYGIGDNKK